MGAADFVSVYLSAFLQRAAWYSHWLYRSGRLRRLLLARPGDGVRRTQRSFAHPMGRATAGELGGDAGDCGGGRDLLLNGVAALSAHYGDWAPFESVVAGRNGNDRMDHLRRADALQRGACL